MAAIPFMSADHAREGRLLDDLAQALEGPRGDRPLAPAIERLSLLAVHTRDHFLREEALMRETGFPGYARHKEEHDRVLSEMDAEVRRFRRDGDAERLSRYLFQTLPAWFANHLRTHDEATARFAARAAERRAP